MYFTTMLPVGSLQGMLSSRVRQPYVVTLIIITRTVTKQLHGGAHTGNAVFSFS